MELVRSDKPSVLVIDDDAQIRRLLLDILNARHRCAEASSAESALIVLAQEHFDVVISDINLGGMSGIELVPLVHSISADSIVLMVSGQLNIETAIEAMRAGAFDYITKPFDIPEVEAATERALRQSLLLKENQRCKDQLEKLVIERSNVINRLVHYDWLTGLPNHSLFEQRLSQALDVVQHAGKLLGIIFVSVDQLKKVNDTLGHLAGDRLMKEVARRLRDCVTDADTVARFRGNVFAILAHIDEHKALVDIFSVIRSALDAPFDLDAFSLFATTSVGISLYPHDARDSDTLLKNADSALNRAKKAGGDRYRFYTEDINFQASAQFALQSGLRHAIENSELVLYYQPRISTDSLHITGVEALVRWQHPQLGLLSPGDFIPLAEELGLLSQMSDWVLRTACSQNREWQRRGFPPMRVAINVSASECQQLLLAETVRQILEETGLEPKFLELELTESSIMSNTQVTLDVLKRLKAMNVKISIDDFGTGFSSLSYLKRLPIDALKIDKSFVQDVTTDQNDAALVMTIVTLAHNLRLQVVAEGVETQEQLKFLHLLRCDEVQGYLFSKPLPASELERVLTTEPGELLSYLELQVCKDGDHLS